MSSFFSKFFEKINTLPFLVPTYRRVPSQWVEKGSLSIDCTRDYSKLFEFWRILFSVMRKTKFCICSTNLMLEQKVFFSSDLRV